MQGIKINFEKSRSTKEGVNRWLHHLCKETDQEALIQLQMAPFVDCEPTSPEPVTDIDSATIPRFDFKINLEKTQLTKEEVNDWVNDICGKFQYEEAIVKLSEAAFIEIDLPLIVLIMRFQTPCFVLKRCLTQIQMSLNRNQKLQRSSQRVSSTVYPRHRSTRLRIHLSPAIQNLTLPHLRLRLFPQAYQPSVRYTTGIP